MRGAIALGALGESAPTGDVVAWNWRTGTATRLSPDAVLEVELAKEDWEYLILAPVLASGIAVLGDVGKFVTAGDARVEVSETETGARLVVKGAGETVTITGWAEAAPTAGDHLVTHDAATGVLRLEVPVRVRGWDIVDLCQGPS